MTAIHIDRRNDGGHYLPPWSLSDGGQVGTCLKSLPTPSLERVCQDLTRIQLPNNGDPVLTHVQEKAYEVASLLSSIENSIYSLILPHKCKIFREVLTMLNIVLFFMTGRNLLIKVPAIRHGTSPSIGWFSCLYKSMLDMPHMRNA